MPTPLPEHCAVQSTVDADRVYSKIFWKLCPILFVGYVVAYLDRVNIGYAKLEMLADLQVSNVAYAFGASIFFWGYMIFEVPSNLMLQRYGARFWIGRIMLTWGAVAVAMAFTKELATFFGVQNTTMFYILRFLLGAFEAGFYPGVVLYINYWMPSNRQSPIMSGFILALPVSLVLGGPLSGWLMQSTHGAAGLLGWQWMLSIEGLMAVAMAGVIFALLPSKPDIAKWLSPDERAFVVDNLERENAHKTFDFRSALRDYRVWIMCGILFCNNTGFYGLSFWLPSIIQAAGVKSTLDIGLLSAIPFFVASILMVWNAGHAVKTGERHWHVAIPATVGGAGLILSSVFASNVPLAITFLCFAASGIVCVMPVYWSHPGRILSGTAAAAGFALINTVGSLAGISGAMITSTMKEWTGSINSGTYVLALFMFGVAILIMILPRDREQVRQARVAVPARDERLVSGSS